MSLETSTAALLEEIAALSEAATLADAERIAARMSDIAAKHFDAQDRRADVVKGFETRVIGLQQQPSKPVHVKDDVDQITWPDFVSGNIVRTLISEMREELETWR